MDQSKQKNKQRRKQQDEQDGQEEQMEVEPINMNQKLQKGDMQQENDMDWEDEEMDVEFIFLDPNENQSTSVKLLVNGYLDGLSFKSSELTEMVVKQVQIGTMVGSEDDDQEEPEYKKKFKEQNVFGFVTILNIKMNQNQPVIREVMKFVLEKSLLHNDKHQQFNDILEKQRVGLFLNERILNLSPQIVPVLHTQLMEDLNWLEKGQDIEFQQFNLDYLLVLTKIFKNDQLQSGKKLYQKVKQQGQLQLGEMIYQKFEDFLFMKKSEQYFYFEAHSNRSQGGLTNQVEKETQEEICYRVIYLIKYKDYLSTIPEIQAQIQ